MIDDPKVSIIIPVYNAEKYLLDSLDSVINQTIKDIEIICVNDGSTDSSMLILDEYAKRDNRVVIINQENAGAGIARNTGLKTARGTYLSFLDADDIYSNTFLEKTYREAEKNSADIIITGVQQLDSNTNIISPLKWVIKDNLLPQKNIFCYRDIPKYIFQFDNGYVWNKLYRKSFIDRNKLKFKDTQIFEDAYFVYQSLIMASYIEVLDEILVTKRRFITTSLTNTKNKNGKDFQSVLDGIKDDLINFGLYSDVEQSFINYALHLTLYVLNTVTGETYKDIYKYLRKDFFPKYNFANFPKEYYYNKKEYDELMEITKKPLIINKLIKHLNHIIGI